MSLRINRLAEFDEDKLRLLKSMVLEKTERYQTHVLTQNDLNFIFLKSCIYVEELVDSILFELYAQKKYGTFGRKIELLKQFTSDKDFKNSYDLLKNVLEIRNSIAHVLDFDINHKQDFFLSVHKRYPESSSNKELLVRLFSDIIHGFLFMESGLKIIDNFIIFRKD